MIFVNDPGDWSQVLEALAEEHAQTQLDLFRCRCPKCDAGYGGLRHRFGIVSGAHDYYGTIYKCSCLPITWVVSPETGEKIEEVGS